MNTLSPEQLETLHVFLEEHRASHLWFWRRDFVPQTQDEWRLALATSAKRADVETWKQIKELEAWL